jgi:DNA-binding XRE family transcriptional regulator
MTFDLSAYAGMIDSSGTLSLSSLSVSLQVEVFMIKPQIIEANGKPAFAVLPYAEWQRIEELLEDAQDNAALESFRRNSEETFPIGVAEALIAGDNPVRVFRKHRKMTLADIAKKCGIAMPYLSQIETGKRKASADVLKKLAGALAVSIDDLI